MSVPVRSRSWSRPEWCCYRTPPLPTRAPRREGTPLSSAPPRSDADRRSGGHRVERSAIPCRKHLLIADSVGSLRQDEQVPLERLSRRALPLPDRDAQRSAKRCTGSRQRCVDGPQRIQVAFLRVRACARAGLKRSWRGQVGRDWRGLDPSHAGDDPDDGRDAEDSPEDPVSGQAPSRSSNRRGRIDVYCLDRLDPALEHLAEVELVDHRAPPSIYALGLQASRDERPGRPEEHWGISIVGSAPSLGYRGRIGRASSPQIQTQTCRANAADAPRSVTEATVPSRTLLGRSVSRRSRVSGSVRRWPPTSRSASGRTPR